MSAARLREALEAAPEVQIAPNAYGQVTIWIDGEAFMFERNAKELRALVLLNLLLAAAPHLADLLDLPPHGPSAPRMADLLGKIDAAVTEAGESL